MPDGTGFGHEPDIITDHPFTPRLEPVTVVAAGRYDRTAEEIERDSIRLPPNPYLCVLCHCAEASHAATAAEHVTALVHRCPDCVTKGVAPCTHGRAVLRDVTIKGGPGFRVESWGPTTTPPFNDAPPPAIVDHWRIVDPDDAARWRGFPNRELADQFRRAIGRQDLGLRGYDEHGKVIVEEGAYVAPVPGGDPTPALHQPGDICPKCGGMMRRTGTCQTCSSCGYNDGCG